MIISRSNSKVDVTNHSSRSQKENIQFSATGARYIPGAESESPEDISKVHVAKVVGATSGEGFSSSLGGHIAALRT